MQPQEYVYEKFIRTPDQMGASSDGNLRALSNDVRAIMGYTDVLMSGKGPAQTVTPLGNRYFMDTETTCEAKEDPKAKRYVLINNVPDGKLPGVPGKNKDFRGLVPGLMEGMGYMDPSKLFSGFSKDKSCQKVTVTVRDETNKVSNESRYVLNRDVEGYDACWFADKRNPVTGAGCEGFQSRPALPKDPVVRFYALGVGLLAAYMMYRGFQKKN